MTAKYQLKKTCTSQTLMFVKAFKNVT